MTRIVYAFQSLIYKSHEMNDEFFLFFSLLLFLFFVHKKTPPEISGGVSNNELAMTYSHMGNPTLPSALRGFTSEFGKGSGGSLLLLSPAQLL